MAEPLRMEQLLYSWSESNLFGRRGFGVVGASAGWLPLLQGGDDMLGPVVAYPEPGRGGAHPPAHGGYTVLRGTPVLFRRMPNGTDALDRPGNYTVQVLRGVDGPIDADTAAALLAGPWLSSPLPAATPKLPLMELPRPGARRGTASTNAAVCGALLQGLRDKRRVVLTAAAEQDGRLALCDALRRLPADLQVLTFSTLESEPERTGFDVCVAVAGWEAGSAARGALRVDVASGDGVDAVCARWGRELAGTTAGSLRGLPEPVTVAVLGTRLDGLAVLRTDPSRLTPEQLLSVLTGPEGQAWAAEPGAAAVTRQVVSGMDPALGPLFAKAASRRPAVMALLRTVGWDVVAGDGGSRRAAESLLRGLGEEQGDIDMAVLSASGGRLSREDSARYLRLLTAKSHRIDGSSVPLTWDAELAAAHPVRWLEAVVLGKAYEGPRADRAVLAKLPPAEVAAVLRQARAEDVMARRLWGAMPKSRRDQVAYLRLLAASGDAGLGVVFERLLAQPELDRRVRSRLLAEFWPILVREMQLPGYLGEAMQPAGSPRGWFGLLAVVIAVGLLTSGVLLL